MASETLTRTDDREQWLEDRKQQIGASEVAAVLGLSSFSTPWEVWATKTGKLDPWEGNASTELGNRFESAVLDEAEERLGPIERNVRIVHPELPLASTLDARLIDGGLPIEAKTTGLTGRAFGEWGTAMTDEVPDYYLCQVHAQLICTGADLAFLFALIGGRGLVQFQIESNKGLHQSLTNRISDWWETHIVRGIEPDRSCLPNIDVVKRLKKTPDKFIELGPDVVDLVERRQTLKDSEKSVRDELKEVDTQIMLALGDAEGAVLPNGMEITHLEQSRRGYTVQPNKFRVLRIKGK